MSSEDFQNILDAIEVKKSVIKKVLIAATNEFPEWVFDDSEKTINDYIDDLFGDLFKTNELQDKMSELSLHEHNQEQAELQSWYNSTRGC